MKPVPQELLGLLQKMAPPEAEIVTLSRAFEHEDYNIAVVMPDSITRTEARQLRDRLLDVIIDWGDAHDTFTVCMVWRQQERAYAGVS